MILNVAERFQNNQKTLLRELNRKNISQLPKITKVSLNIGLGQHRTNKEMMSYIEQSLAQITGQKPVATLSRKAVAGFKLRQGETVGLRVTLRGTKMNDFLNRLINVTLPRIREFRGIAASQFDGQGNLTIGFKDQSAFAELGPESLDRPFGLSATISIARSDPGSSQVLLKSLGFPLKTS